jgi:hypothetical protein
MPVAVAATTALARPPRRGLRAESRCVGLGVGDPGQEAPPRRGVHPVRHVLGPSDPTAEPGAPPGRDGVEACRAARLRHPNRGGTDEVPGNVAPVAALLPDRPVRRTSRMAPPDRLRRRDLGRARVRRQVRPASHPGRGKTSASGQRGPWDQAAGTVLEPDLHDRRGRPACARRHRRRARIEERPARRRKKDGPDRGEILSRVHGQRNLS